MQRNGSNRACFHSQLLKVLESRNLLVSLPSLFIAGFSGQVFQSSVRGRHGYNLKSVDKNEKNVTLPFEMIFIIFTQICNATPKM